MAFRRKHNRRHRIRMDRGTAAVPPITVPPIPAPLFLTLPSILTDGTPQVGEQLVGVPGVVTGATSVAVRWLLGSTALATLNAFTPGEAGRFTFEVTATGPGGTTVRSATVDVAVADGTLSPEQRELWAGMGLNGVDAYFMEAASLDRMKYTSGFRTDGAGGDQYLNPGNSDAAFDANGWPTRLPDGKTSLYFGVPAPGIGKPGVTVDEYEMLWEGGTGTEQVFVDTNTATIVPGSRSGRRVLIKGAVLHGAAMQLGFTGCDPTNPPHHISIVRKDQAPLFAEWKATVTAQKPEGDLSKVFNPEFLASRTGNQVIRFMDWSGVNSRTDTSWAARVGPARFSWMTATGVPIEVQVALCKKLDCVGWFNIPVDYVGDILNATPKYVPTDTSIRAWARYLIAEFPDRPLFAEFGNEIPWNDGTRGAHLFNPLADPTGANRDGPSLWMQQTGLDWNNAAICLYYRTYAHRILMEEWAAAGKAHLLRSVLAVQTVGETQATLQNQTMPQVLGFTGNAKLPGLDVAQLNEVFTDLAITGYRSFGLYPATRSDENYADVLAAAKGGASGITKALTDWQDGSQFRINPGAGRAATADEAVRLAGLNVQFAVANGLTPITYEESCHMINAYASEAKVPGTNLKYKEKYPEYPVITDLMLNVVRSPGAYDFDRKFRRDMRAKGVELLTQFTDVSAYDANGSWGLENYTGERMTDGARTPRFRAYDDHIANPGPLKARAPLTVATTIAQHSATVGSSDPILFMIRGGKGPYRIERLSGTAAPGRSVKLKRIAGAYTTAGRYDAVYRVTDSSTPRQVVDVPIGVDVALPVANGYSKWQIIITQTGLGNSSRDSGGTNQPVKIGTLAFRNADGTIQPHGAEGPNLNVQVTPGTVDNFTCYRPFVDTDPTSRWESVAGDGPGRGPRAGLVWDYDASGTTGLTRRPAQIGIAVGDWFAYGPSQFKIQAFDKAANAWVTIVDMSAPSATTTQNPVGYSEDGSQIKWFACLYP